MPLTEIATLNLEDDQGTVLGTVAIERIDAGRVHGEFTAGAGFSRVEPLFLHLADVIDQQSFSYLDAAQEAIAALGIVARLPGEVEPIPVTDVQIYPDGAFMCRLP